MSAFEFELNKGYPWVRVEFDPNASDITVVDSQGNQKNFNWPALIFNRHEVTKIKVSKCMPQHLIGLYLPKKYYDDLLNDVHFAGLPFVMIPSSLSATPAPLPTAPGRAVSSFDFQAGKNWIAVREYPLLNTIEAIDSMGNHSYHKVGLVDVSAISALPFIPNEVRMNLQDMGTLYTSVVAHGFKNVVYQYTTVAAPQVGTLATIQAPTPPVASFKWYSTTLQLTIDIVESVSSITPYGARAYVATGLALNCNPPVNEQDVVDICTATVSCHNAPCDHIRLESTYYYALLAYYKANNVQHNATQAASSSSSRGWQLVDGVKPVEPEIKLRMFCGDCNKELCEYLDAYYGNEPWLATLCDSCRRKRK